MPLWKSSSKRAFKHNIRTEVRSGRPVKQSVAIAYSTQRRAAEQNRCGCGTCNASGMGKHLSADAKDFRYIKKEARDIARAVTRLERRDSGMKRNRSGHDGTSRSLFGRYPDANSWLRDHGVAPMRWDGHTETYVPAYTASAGRVYLTKLRVSRDGYVGARYYGTGAPIYYAESEDGSFSMTFRAGSREAAKAMLTGAFPTMRFRR